MRLAVVGASGFVGRAVTEAAGAKGHAVHGVAAPRVRTNQQTTDGLRSELERHAESVYRLADAFAGCDVVINAAGMAEAGSGDAAALMGANALLPALAVEACRRAEVPRLIHVSSAAVQGRRAVLDETTSYDGFTPYARSKILGELAVLGSNWAGNLVYRPTSVHGGERRVSASLAKLARSPLSSVAGDGSCPTPQILAPSVGSAVEFVATAGSVPRIVMHPWEGMTTGALLEHLGAGRRPRRVPTTVARRTVRLAMASAELRPGAQGIVRRLEMLWFGQAQSTSWLTAAGWHGPTSHHDWRSLGERFAQASMS